MKTKKSILFLRQQVGCVKEHGHISIQTETGTHIVKAKRREKKRAAFLEELMYIMPEASEREGEKEKNLANRE